MTRHCTTAQQNVNDLSFHDEGESEIQAMAYGYGRMNEVRVKGEALDNDYNDVLATYDCSMFMSQWRSGHGVPSINHGPCRS